MRAVIDRDGVAALPLGGEAAWGADRLTTAALAIILIGAIPLQRFGIDIAEGTIAISLPLTLAAIALLLLCGRVELNLGRLVWYMLAMATLALVTTVGAKVFSLASFILLCVLYASFVFQLAPNRLDHLSVVRLFQNFVLVGSIAGILQFLLQFIIPGPYLFSFDWFVPDQFLMDGFNTVIPLYWGASHYKSNGFFFLEPSHFSQFSAIAIVAELLFFERKLRLIIYAAGLLLSYSGTGLLLLVWALPVIFLMRRQYWLIWLGVLGAAVLLAFGEALNIDVFAERMQEFTSERSSGFGRFIAPWLLLGEHLIDDASALLFGKGPGVYMAYTRGSYRVWDLFEPHDPTWAKLIFEYGVIGFTVFLGFILYSLFAASPSRFLALALLFGYMSFGGMLLNIQYHAVMLVLAVLPRPEEDAWVAAAGAPAPPPTPEDATVPGAPALRPHAAPAALQPPPGGWR